MKSFSMFVESPDDFGNEITKEDIEEALRDIGWSCKVYAITDEDGD